MTKSVNKPTSPVCSFRHGVNTRMTVAFHSPLAEWYNFFGDDDGDGDGDDGLFQLGKGLPLQLLAS